ncbi:MAG: Na+/H+ antiporter NhaC [Balneola sp.]|nr:Na+/H+ antiporter NhaC [Balneola sp.]MAO77899.1 Na+/H+ antiporter NhaC [Balneola sp.]MBF63353.1 Na+/H+ antiporter NhaC [Balneola sp.]HAW81576.1 Na+/H+ antiporter NhaC [Balneola sp.]|tara:strand:+ start:24351 stop:25808 length:1458 start_codon:yes stop_codon:yes gene_type:complete
MTYKYDRPTLLQSFIPIIFLIIALFINVRIYGDASLDGSNQIILMLSAGVASLVALGLGIKWAEIRQGIVDSISSAMSSMIILLLIGSLAGTWLLSGIIPAMIYYGLQILNPAIFLVAACIVCAIVSVATGSSWTTSATVGIALVAIGTVLKIPVGMVAGAIISGAYFGDKMSPLSDTTNLAPAMAGTDLFTHIRYMAYTTIPSISIALVIFLILGFVKGGNVEIAETQVILDAISGKFEINFWLFLVPIIMVVLISKKMPAIPAISVGALLGAVFALIFQPDLVQEVAQFGEGTWEKGFVGIMTSMYGDISFTTDNEIVDGLLSSGGMYGMLGTVWLILSAMIFGGVMERSGMLKRIAEGVISGINSAGALIATTAGTCVFFNITASDQYLAIVVPGRMYADVYKEKGLAPENLSRTLEDSGTVTSALIPWNTCGAYHAKVLGVETFTYLPFAFFNLISPFMTVIFGVFKIKLRMLKDSKTADA